ncbi:hypothetical protein [Actinospica sp.]|jgi:hypothetical protein|uniref:hypothetical protein n=1 Tax=Actinospica sp. TaxID=1872142 RepID=UPI002BD99D81|nr:hypothetical protein [Actinospica sp.]HWG27448.1 hypothetical protein [Actinospica sp.]
MAVLSGTHDIHNPDARDFAARAREAGVCLDYHGEPGSQHVHPLLPTAEGAAARKLIAALIGNPSGQRRGGWPVPFRWVAAGTDSKPCPNRSWCHSPCLDSDHRALAHQPRSAAVQRGEQRREQKGK